MEQLLKILEEIPEGNRQRFVDGIARKNVFNNVTRMDTLVKTMENHQRICVPLGEFGALLEDLRYYEKAAYEKLLKFSTELQKNAKAYVIPEDDLKRLSDWLDGESHQTAIKIVCEVGKIPPPIDLQAQPKWLVEVVQSRLHDFVTALQETSLHGEAFGLTAHERDCCARTRKVFESNVTGTIVLRLAHLNKSHSRKSSETFANSKSKRRIVETSNALTELAKERSIPVPELRTLLKDADLVDALNEKVPTFLGGKDFPTVMASLTEEWATLANAMIGTICDKTLFNYNKNVEDLQYAINYVRSTVSLPELLCWGEPNEAKRKRWVYENLFKEGMVDPVKFFSIVGENSALAQPKKFNTIDPEHMQSMFDDFITKVRKHPEVFDEMLKKSSRAAPLAAIERALLPPLEVNVADLVMPKLAVIKEFDFPSVFAEVASHFEDPKAVEEEFVKAMELWKEKDLFATSSRDDLIETLRSILFDDADCVDMTPILLLLAEFEAHGITQYGEK